MQARALAHSNIALAKYWGKADSARNLTAVPSLSLTLDNLKTETSVSFDPGLSSDALSIDGNDLGGRPLQRVSSLLDRVRALSGVGLRARVASHNDFLTAAGLASSASGFAALALAASAAAGLELDVSELSSLARAASASAARSLFGGYVVLAAGAAYAEPLLSPDQFPLRMLVAVTAQGEKPNTSTSAMEHTRATSPYYPAWVASAPAVFERVRAAVLARDLERLGAAMEHSTLLMHASMWGAQPAINYFLPATLAVMHAVHELRRGGTAAYYTMDAGPHVKVLCQPGDAQRVGAALAGVPGVSRVISAAPGPAARLLDASP